MRCYYHSDIEAVAVCQGCGRALCAQCIAVVGRKTACKNECEEDVRVVNEIIEANRKWVKQLEPMNRTAGGLIGMSRTAYRATGWLAALFGLAMLGFSFVLTDAGFWLFHIIGWLMIGFGLVYLFLAAKMSGSDDEREKPTPETQSRST